MSKNQRDWPEGIKPDDWPPGVSQGTIQHIPRSMIPDARQEAWVAFALGKSADWAAKHHVAGERAYQKHTAPPTDDMK